MIRFIIGLAGLLVLLPISTAPTLAVFLYWVHRAGRFMVHSTQHIGKPPEVRKTAPVPFLQNRGHPISLLLT